MQAELALARQERLDGIATSASARGVTAWRRGMGTNFDASWARIVAQLTDLTAAGQVAAAAGSTPFVTRVAAADDVGTDSAGPVQAGAFAGVDASGRGLDGLLYGAVTTAKTLIGGGSGVQGALIGGATFLATMIHTAILDTGRSADLTASTSRKYTHYVRAISPGACSRCAILAGMSSARTPFQRHPRCRCIAVPETDTTSSVGKFTNPTDYFNSLSRAEQDRVFTNAGAEAIRAGADPISVVTARRGAPGIDYSRAVLDPKTLPNSGRRLTQTVIGRDRDGQPILGYTTGESTTIRGQFGKQNRDAGLTRRTNARTGRLDRYRTTNRVRLMPETIVGLTDDVDLRRILLRDAGYLDVPMTADELRSPLGGTFFARRSEIRREDRIAATDFYRSLGITLA